MRLFTLWSAYVLLTAARHAVAQDIDLEDPYVVLTSYTVSTIILTSYGPVNPVQHTDAPTNSLSGTDASPSTSVNTSTDTSPPTHTPTSTSTSTSMSSLPPTDTTTPPVSTDHPTSTTSSKSTTSSSSTCTSDATAHKVTVVCKPTSITAGGSTVKTIACSPTTTITTTGCSVTDTTTTVTPTPSLELCSPEKCGNGQCPGKGGSGWVSLSSVDCAHLATSTAAKFPVKSGISITMGNSGVAQRRNNEMKRADTDPLPGVANLEAHLRELNQKIGSNHQWLYFEEPTAGKWFPFPREVTAMGVKGLWGCTAVAIISRKGTYISHIYEDEVFKKRTNGRIVDTLDAWFDKWTVEALWWGGDEFFEVEALKPLVGTKDQPGPLHPSLSPHIFIATPFHEGLQQGPLQYRQRAEKIGSGLANYIYQETGLPQDGTPPWIISGYEVTGFEPSNNDNSLAGKVIIEATQVHRIQQFGNQQLAIGSWRLWIGGRFIVSLEFWDPSTISHNQRRASQSQEICPLKTSPHSTFSTSSKTKTTSKTTSKTKTKTKHPSQTVNPPGQPPGFTLPTATRTENNLVNPPGQPPGFILPLPTATKPPGFQPPAEGKVCLADKDYVPAETNQDKINAVAKQCKDALSGKGPIGAGDESLDWGPVKERYADYYGSVHWIDGCKGPAQDPLSLKGDDCETIMKKNFDLTWCEKGKSENGRGKPSWGLPYGAYTRIGCLGYRSWRSDGGVRIEFRKPTAE